MDWRTRNTTWRPAEPVSRRSSSESESSDSFRMFDLESSVQRGEGKTGAKDYLGTEEVRRMKAKNEYSLLYRPDTSGGLLQVVRRRPFGPAKATDLEHTHLHEPEISLFREPELTTITPAHVRRHHREESRYPYWSFAKQQQSAQAQRSRACAVLGHSVSSKASTVKPVTAGRPIRISAKIKTANVQLPRAAFFQQHKVKRSLPNLESISLAQTDLGLSSIPERIKRKLSVEPVPFFSTKLNNRKTVRKKTQSQRLTATLPTEQKTVSEKEPQGDYFNPEDFGKGRQLIEQAKRLISSGGFARFYDAEQVKDNAKLMKLLGFTN